jgi:hypothetical protein
MQMKLCQADYVKYFIYYVRSTYDMPMQAQRGAEVQLQPIRNPAPRLGRIAPGKGPGTYFRRGWVGLGVRVDGTEKLFATEM